MMHYKIVNLEHCNEHSPDTLAVVYIIVGDAQEKGMEERQANTVFHGCNEPASPSMVAICRNDGPSRGIV